MDDHVIDGGMRFLLKRYTRRRELVPEPLDWLGEEEACQRSCSHLVL